MRKLFLGMAALSLTALPATLSARSSMDAGPTADQLNRDSPPAPANTVVTRDPVTGAPDTVIRNYPGNMVTTPPVDMAKSYPVCSATLQDSCQNPGEGGAPGRSRALKHWPGKPASEM